MLRHNAYEASRPRTRRGGQARILQRQGASGRRSSRRSAQGAASRREALGGKHKLSLRGSTFRSIVRIELSQFLRRFRERTQKLFPRGQPGADRGWWVGKKFGRERRTYLEPKWQRTYSHGDLLEAWPWTRRDDQSDRLAGQGTAAQRGSRTGTTGFNPWAKKAKDLKH